MKIVNENAKINIASYGGKIERKSKTESKSDSKTMATLSEEKVALSDQAKELNEVNTAIKMVPDVREEKIAMIKEQIANGTYKVDHEKIAEKIILDILETRSIK